MVAFVAVPAVLAGSEEGVDLRGIGCQLAAANAIRDGIGGQTSNVATAGYNGFTHFACDLYSIAQFCNVTCGDINIPLQGVAIQAKTICCGNKGGVCRNVFSYRQIFVGGAGIRNAVGRMVCCVISIVAIVGDDNGIGNLSTLYSGSHMGNIYRAVDIHSGILHPDVGGVLNRKIGCFEGAVVKIQLRLQQTGIQLIGRIQNIIPGIIVAVVDRQKVERTNNDDGVGLCAGSKITNIEVRVVGVQIITLDGIVINGTVGFKGIKTGVHLVFAAIGVQNDTVTNIKHSVAGIIEDNNIAGTHRGFIVLEEGIDFVCIIPATIIADAELGIIGIIQIAFALGMPAQNRHIIGIAGGAPKSHRQTVELVSKNRIVKCFFIYIKAVAAAHGIGGLIGGCRLGRDIQCLTAVSTAVAAQRCVITKPASGV